MKRIPWVTVLLSVTLLVWTAAAASKPNIIIILADDMGWSDLGCMGGEIRTPTLDGLAENGLRFTQFYNTARCCPTRASLLTGLYPHSAGVGHMMDDRNQPGYRGDLNTNAVTIAEALRPAGYRNYAVGKWHVTRFTAPDGPKHNWPLQRGFDRFYGTIHGAGSFFDPSTLTRDNQAISPFADPEYRPTTYYYTDAISDHAIRFIREHREKQSEQPFFLYVAYTAAHWPMHALPEDIARQRGKYDEGYRATIARRMAKQKELGLVREGWAAVPEVGDWDAVKDKRWEAAGMEVYAAMVECMDRGIGRVVEELKVNGELDNTLIFYLQDNGGCAEGMGRTGSAAHPEARRSLKPTLPPLARDALLPPGSVPPQTREGFPILMGKLELPGPGDTYMAYGEGWAHVSNTPFREYKHWVHEGGIATPLIAHWPKGMARSVRGKLEPQPGHLVDLMATCVDVGRAEYPKVKNGEPVHPADGVSLAPAFRGRDLKRSEPIFWEHEGNRALRDGKWKLVAKGPGGPWELYDMESDRTEMRDLASAEPERARKMAAQWEDWAKANWVLPWIWKPAFGQAAAGTSAGAATAKNACHLWGVYEGQLRAAAAYEHPLWDATVKIELTSPSGKTHQVEGFWYGARQWRFRFSPNETGTWKWRSSCSNTADSGLNGQNGSFECAAYVGNKPLYQHGPVQVKGTYFAHADGTPFFWMADTAWNGLLRSTEQDWAEYLSTRQEQGFNVIQCVLTQWRGGRETLAEPMYYTNAGKLAVNPGICRTIDSRLGEINAQGLLAAPVLLWALTPPDPGRALSEADAIRLARYMTARWGAHQVAWFLGGDGDYGNANAERWRMIGRNVFKDRHDRLVTLHPGGSKWVLREFREESWFDFVGYQSGHGGSDSNLRWLTDGPPARDWQQKPERPFVNLEPNYELHSGKNPFTDYHVRRAAYWSLLVAPACGVSYGNSPIWVWNERKGPAEGHERLGDVESWRTGLKTPGIASMTRLKEFFSSGPFQELRPAPELLEEQPGLTRPSEYIAVAQDPRDTWTVAYLPRGGAIQLRSLQPGLAARWYNPRTGEFTEGGRVAETSAKLQSPTANEDWVLDLR